MAIAQFPPRFKPGQNVPAVASGAIAGGTFVKVAGDKDVNGSYQVAHCVLGDLAFGVAEYDADPSLGNRINVIRPGAIARVQPGANLTAGQLVCSDVNGKAIVATTGKQILGQVMANALSTDPHAEIVLFYGGIAP